MRVTLFILLVLASLFPSAVHAQGNCPQDTYYGVIQKGGPGENDYYGCIPKGMGYAIGKTLEDNGVPTGALDRAYGETVGRLTNEPKWRATHCREAGGWITNRGECVMPEKPYSNPQQWYNAIRGCNPQVERCR